MRTDRAIQSLERQFRAGVITRYEFEYFKRIGTPDPREQIEEDARIAEERACENDRINYGN